MPAMSPLRAYAQLIRLPNLATALADPLAGWWLLGGGWTWPLPALLGASACLYSAGMAFNDCFDYAADCRHRPERPLPRGLITRPAAWVFASGLLLAGLTLAWSASTYTLRVALVLAVVMLLYNGLRKMPALLGVCRALNLSLAGPVPWWAPATLGLYVIALSFLAQREEQQPAVRPVVKRLLLGIIVLDAALVAVTGSWLGAGTVLALLLPAWLLGRYWEMT
jgi:4-hydroxybenzoate polyprenyltransferase